MLAVFADRDLSVC
jgi:hypothetical protein